MLDSGHNCIGLTVHAFNEFISDCIVTVADCNILAFQRPFVPFDSFNPLAVLYDSDENEDISNVNEANDSCVNETNQDGELYSKMLPAGGSNASE